MFKGNIPVWALYAFVAYFVAFVLLAGGLFLWWARHRKERPPKTFRLLRGPGETLRRRVQKADEDMFLYFFAAAFSPLVLLCLLLSIVARLPKDFILTGAAIALLMFLVGLIIAWTRLFRFLRRRRDDLIGYLGERAVAECFEPLKTEGFRVFYDVPAEGERRKFNIDHVVIGPTGVAMIEVKTRRKKKGREGYKDYEVTYDGQTLIWPWGHERWGIDQLQSEADWLRKFIYTRTGLRVDPKPILALPGWWVTERVVGAFRVTNDKLLPAIVRDWKSQSLTPEQIDLISRQLDERCRDVED